MLSFLVPGCSALQLGVNYAHVYRFAVCPRNATLLLDTAGDPDDLRRGPRRDAAYLGEASSIMATVSSRSQEGQRCTITAEGDPKQATAKAYYSTFHAARALRRGGDSEDRTLCDHPFFLGSSHSCSH